MAEATLEQKVDRILFYLESDRTTNQEGLVEKVNRIDRIQSDMLTREKTFKAKVSGIALVLTVLFNVAIWLFNKFIK